MIFDDTRQSKQARLGELARVFGTSGSFTFGGGSATISALEREIVGRRHWIDGDRFALCYAISRMTPGTNLLAFCVAAGAILRGGVGAFTALIAASIPCSLIAVGLTVGMAELSGVTWFRALLGGVIAAAVGSLGSTAWLLMRPHLKPARRIRTIVLFVSSLILSVSLGFSAIAVLALSAVAGWAWTESE